MKNRSIILIITIAILGFYLSSCVEDVLDIDDTKKPFRSGNMEHRGCS